MTTQGTIRLAAGHLELELSPHAGGSISAFEWIDGGRSSPILRQCPTPVEKALDACCFPLVPYVNRIRGGHFRFRGQTIMLRPNMAGDPSPLHGQGWLNPWDVERAGPNDAVLSYRHRADEWPWDYEAWQHFSLDETGLSVTLSCSNLSTEPMPCGLGQHPYFPCGPQTRLATVVADVWTIDENVLPVEKVRADGRYDLKDRLICGQDLDNGFCGWDGEALLSDPEWGWTVRLSSGDARFFQVYSPPEGRTFVAEPVTHANAALNAPEAEWPELGMQVLAPGSAMALTMRLDVRPG